MTGLLVSAVLVGFLVLGRRLLRLSGLDWRSAAGFCVGGALGLVLGRAVERDAGELVRATGVPWLIFRVLFVWMLGVAAAGPVREILEEAFPRGPGRRKDGSDERKR